MSERVTEFYLIPSPSEAAGCSLVEGGASSSKEGSAPPPAKKAKKGNKDAADAGDLFW